jgi:hypothetical protein
MPYDLICKFLTTTHRRPGRAFVGAAATSESAWTRSSHRPGLPRLAVRLTGRRYRLWTRDQREPECPASSAGATSDRSQKGHGRIPQSKRKTSAHDNRVGASLGENSLSDAGSWPLGQFLGNFSLVGRDRFENPSTTADNHPPTRLLHHDRILADDAGPLRRSIRCC